MDIALSMIGPLLSATIARILLAKCKLTSPRLYWFIGTLGMLPAVIVLALHYE